MDVEVENPTVCDQCGATISGAQPGGQCAACLLKRGLGEFESVGSDADELAETVVPQQDQQSPAAQGFSQRKQSEFAPEETFGDYKIVRRLGRGGMGTVYEADHLPTGRRIALKVLSHSLDSEEARARFLREGRLAASINHPNSVYVFGTEEIEGVPTISMELGSGGTLGSLVHKFGAMPIPDAVDAILQVIEGLEAAEQKGVLHRDVKPANCFINAQSEVKVGDFGLSISTMPTDVTALTMTQEGTFLGTPAFASPEQLRGEQLDQRSDIYSVGVTLYYLLTGKAPFESKNLVQLLATVLDKQAVPVSDVRADVPEALFAIVNACLAKSSGSRPASYAELKKRLLPFSSKTAEPATIPQRFVAGLIDYLALFVIQSSLSAIAVSVGLLEPFSDSSGPHNFRLMAVTLLYFVICECVWGQTIGKRLLGIRVTSVARTPSFKQALIRALCYVCVVELPDLFADLMADRLLSRTGPEAFRPWAFQVASIRLITCGLSLW